MTFSIHEIAWTSDGPLFGSGRVIEYRVQATSPCDEAFVANFGSWQHDNWKILKVKDGRGADWMGGHGTAARAFASLGIPFGPD